METESRDDIFEESRTELQEEVFVKAFENNAVYKEMEKARNKLSEVDRSMELAKSRAQAYFDKVSSDFESEKKRELREFQREQRELVEKKLEEGLKPMVTMRNSLLNQIRVCELSLQAGMMGVEAGKVESRSGDLPDFVDHM